MGRKFINFREARMKLKKILTGGIASVALSLGLVAGVYAASVNTNGSFETGVDPGVFTPLAAVDNSSIDDWTIVSGNVDYIGSYWTSSDGDRSLDMTGSDGSAGAVSQTLTTVSGHTYEVTFDLAGNPAGPPAIKTLEVDAGGAPQSYTFDTTGQSLADMGWTQETFTFTASGPSTTLTFTSLDPGFYGPALDNVVVTDVLTSVEQCKKGGWQTYTDPAFKSQGDCVSYFQSSPNAIGNHNQ
jgi:choice-of-anchor C domain-containing protein